MHQRRERTVSIQADSVFAATALLFELYTICGRVESVIIVFSNPWKLQQRSGGKRSDFYACWLREQLTHSELEIIEGVLVDNIQLPY